MPSLYFSQAVVLFCWCDVKHYDTVWSLFFSLSAWILHVPRAF